MARSPQHRARSRRDTAAEAAARTIVQQKLNKLGERVGCARRPLVVLRPTRDLRLRRTPPPADVQMSTPTQQCPHGPC